MDLQSNTPQPASARPNTGLAVHPSWIFETYFEEEFSKLSDNSTRQEIRDFGRNVGKKILSLLNQTAEDSTAKILLRRAADLIDSHITDSSYQAACWGNVRKGFVGEFNSFFIGQHRATLIDAVEASASEYNHIFFRYPQIKNQDDILRHKQIFELVTDHFPTASDQEKHEASFLLYNMSFVRKELTAYAKEFHPGFTAIANTLLSVCKECIALDSNRKLCEMLRTLSRIAAIYDKASYRILQGRKVQESFKKSGWLAYTKHDLFRRIRTPEQMSALLHRGVQSSAASLVARGSYLGRLFLDTIVDFPAYGPSLHLNKPQTKAALEERYAALMEGIKPSASAYALKEFISVAYLNIGLGCLNQEPGTDTYYENVSKDVALLSEFVFNKVTSLAFDELLEKYTAPDTKVAFIVGGANARREYPSFDYDWYCVYEQDGFVRSRVNDTPLSYQEFFTALAKKINSKLVSFGASSDIGFAPHDPVTLETHWATTKQTYDALLARSPDLHLELRLRVNNVFLAGDSSFGKQWLTYTGNLIKQNSHYILIDRARDLVSLSKKDLPSDGSINIKYDSGGLRQATLLWLFCSTAFNQKFHSMNDVIKLLTTHDHLSNADAINFLHSYHFLLGLRVRLDMQYGRNDKQLPTGSELIALAKSVGFEHAHNQSGADQMLLNEVLIHMGHIRRITSLAITNLQKTLLSEKGFDIFDVSLIKPLEEQTLKARQEFRHFQMIRNEERPWETF